MNLATVLMLVILAAALAIIAVVAVGMQGDLRRSSKVASMMAQTAKHLNGEAPPPQALVDFWGELPKPGTQRPSSETPAKPAAPHA